MFWGSKITAYGDGSHEIKRRLVLGRKTMANLGSILKSRDITLSTKVRLVKAMVFPVVMYGCDSWTAKKAECRRIDAFELWCWKTLESPLDSKVTLDGDCSHEIKRHLYLGRKVMTNLDSIIKSRDITLLTKVCIVRAMVFPVVMYGCDSWTIKKAEC